MLCKKKKITDTYAKIKTISGIRLINVIKVSWNICVHLSLMAFLLEFWQAVLLMPQLLRSMTYQGTFCVIFFLLLLYIYVPFLNNSIISKGNNSSAWKEFEYKAILECHPRLLNKKDDYGLSLREFIICTWYNMVLIADRRLYPL